MHYLLVDILKDINFSICGSNKDINNIFVSSICSDSNSVVENCIFVAIDGVKSKGSKYIGDSIKLGASVIVLSTHDSCDAYDNGKVVFIKVENTTIILPKMLCNFYNNQIPQNMLTITGTNGKTSTTKFLEQMLGFLNKESISVGTLGVSLAKEEIYTGLTTPFPCDLWAYLHKAYLKNIKYGIMESSSHGIEQNRVSEIKFKAIGWTNLSQDHLDYHKNMANYYESKRKLFLQNKNALAVINVDDEWGGVLSQDCKNAGIKTLTYGYNGDFLKLINIQSFSSYQIFTIQFKNIQYDCKLNIIGNFQVYNVLCAMGLLVAIGFDLTDIIKHIDKLVEVQGRLNLINYNNAKIFVDFAHTPNALEEVLKNLQMEKPKKLNVLFGCGGNRDASKRGKMGEIAAKYCNTIYVTDDNPRFEDPNIIRKEIIEGITNHSNTKNFYDMGDRKSAIIKAIDDLQNGEILLIAGKGHENGQYIKDEIIPFNDTNVVKEYIELLENGISSKQLASITSGDALCDFHVTSYVINTKMVNNANQCFIAIRGVHNDGHNYIKDAISNNVGGIIVDYDYYTKHLLNDNSSFKNYLVVEDTKKALIDIAKYKRQIFNNPIVGITGSVGKTTLKDMLVFALSLDSKVSATFGNFNNHIGLPLSVANMHNRSQYGVFEMGMSSLGEIDYLGDILQPNVAIITNIGTAHSEFFHNQDEIAQAKLEILNHLDKNGYFFINTDDKYANLFYDKGVLLGIENIVTFSMGEKLFNNKLIDIYIKSNSYYFNSVQDYGYDCLICVFGNEYRFKIKTISAHNIINAGICFGVGHIFNIDLNKLSNLFHGFNLPKGRGSIEMVKLNNSNNIMLIDDSYNASPTSMISSIDNLSRINANKCLILGEMLELGSLTHDAHLGLLDHIIKQKCKWVILVGKAMGELYTHLQKNDIVVYYFDKVNDLIMEYVNGCNDGDVLLIKGSYGSGVHEIIKDLL